MTWSRIVPIGVFLILVVFMAIGLTRDPSVIPTEMIDREMPQFELPELYAPEETIKTEDLTGETTLVNVFGSWCVACLKEHPTLMRLARDDTVQIVGINWRDERGDALAWLEKHGDPYAHIVYDAQSDLVIEMGVTGAPETFVVDPSGRIRYKQIGPITQDVWDDTIRPVIEAIAAETEAAS